VKVLLAIAGVIGAVLVCAGVGVLVVRWLFGPNDVADRDRDGDHYE
jgi:hypothetical protein